MLETWVEPNETSSVKALCQAMPLSIVRQPSNVSVSERYVHEMERPLSLCAMGFELLLYAYKVSTTQWHSVVDFIMSPWPWLPWLGAGLNDSVVGVCLCRVSCRVLLSS